MLRPLKHEDDQLICSHWKNWPPPVAWMQAPLEELRASGEITEPMYQRALVWQRHCGKKKMDESCVECPLVRRIEVRSYEPYAVTLDGTSAAKIQDLQQAEAAPKFRRGKPAEVAAWLANLHFMEEQKNKEKAGGEG